MYILFCLNSAGIRAQGLSRRRSYKIYNENVHIAAAAAFISFICRRHREKSCRLQFIFTLRARTQSCIAIKFTLSPLLSAEMLYLVRRLQLRDTFFFSLSLHSLIYLRRRRRSSCINYASLILAPFHCVKKKRRTKFLN